MNLSPPTHAQFVHLRVHSSYSLSQSTLRIGKLAELAAADRQPALAVTDSFNMFGAYDVSQIMRKHHIQPIIGAVIDLKDEAGAGDVVLLAQNEQGYIHLSKLISRELLRTHAYDDPQIVVDDLAPLTDGLILLTGGYRKGFIGRPAAMGQTDLAKTRLMTLADLFQGRIYIELQRHGHRQEEAGEASMLALADETGLPLVATNDCHFEDATMFMSQKVLHCIATSQHLTSMQNADVTEQHYFKSADEMCALFQDIPEAIDNSLIIAKRCSYFVDNRDPILPSTEAVDEATKLRELAEQGLHKRLAEIKTLPDSYFGGSDAEIARYFARLTIELDMIIEMGFPGYFLIVSDFIRWAKENNIAVGPGRGSGAGSVVAWALLITDLDPLRWGLLFERFLNPERVSMPDFDIDFCQERREDVIRYVQHKYGYERVAQIITFGTLQARAALRDVGRVLDMPYSLVDKLAKLIPANPANPVSIAQALKSEPDFKQMYDQDEQTVHLVNTAVKLEGLYRHASTHAAGLVIGDRDLTELVPVCRDARSDMPVTQFNMKAVEQVGLVKFDFLGLKTLTVIEKTIELLKHRGLDIDITRIPLNDSRSFAMLTEGDTVGIFQLESSGMRDVLRTLKPDRLEDIIAVVALYRPGPMDNIPTYVRRKHGREQVSYMHKLLEPILQETYGIMIYQEQVQQAARDLAGYTLGGADILRRAMGKKIKAEMDQQRGIFIEGAGKNGIDAKLASDIFDQIASFAGYGFNKSHAAAYALLCYQTAWLKANHPVEFLAASMTLDASNTEKLAIFRQDCIAHHIDVLPPDINLSQPAFAVEETAPETLAIRYALGAVRHVGVEAMVKLAKERAENGPYETIDHFLQRLSKEVTNKRQLESLIKSGAFDSLHKNRRQLFDGLEQLLAISEFYSDDALSLQSSLFDGSQKNATPHFRPDGRPDWPAPERLSMEFEAMGLYLSTHPLDSYAQQIKDFGVVSSLGIAAAMGTKSSAKLRLAGIISALRERVSSKGRKYAFLQICDKEGVFEAMIFSELIPEAKKLLHSDEPVLATIDVQMENGALRLGVTKLQSLDDATAHNYSGTGVGIWIEDTLCLAPIKSALHEDGTGKAMVKFFVIEADTEIEIALPNRFRLSRALLQKLRSISGIVTIKPLVASL